MPDQLGFAIVGCGMIARFHARAIQEIPAGRVAGLVSRTPSSARKLLDETGTPACPVFATVEQAVRDPGVDGGGALMNQAIHNVDLLLWMMGDAAAVTGLTATLAHERIEVEDTAVAAIRFKNGALGVLMATTSVHPGYPKQIAIHGDKGSAV